MLIDTPENYEPPYFGPSSSSYCLRMIGDFKTLAKIHTGYQSLAMRATGETVNLVKYLILKVF